MNITISIDYRTVWGERLVLVLSDGKRVDMTYSSAKWVAMFSMPKSAKTINYNFEVVNQNGDTIRTEWGGSHSYPLTAAAKYLVVEDCWSERPQNRAFYTSMFTDTIFAHQSQAADALAAGGVMLEVEAPTLSRGEALALAGSTTQMGEWNEECLRKMVHTGDAHWSIVLDTAQSAAEYKFVVIDTATGKVVRWEEGENRQLPYFGVQGAAYIIRGLRLRDRATWRGAGVAVPMFSLRSNNSFGVGDFGDLKLLADWCVRTGQNIIQILPINDTTMTRTWKDSYPYNANSTIALHPLYINLEAAGKLKKKADRDRFAALAAELNALPEVDYERALNGKFEYLHLLFEQSGEKTLSSKDYKAFAAANEGWLTPYAVYSVLRDKYKTADFKKWGSYSEYSAKKCAAFAEKNADLVNFYRFIQFHLDRQLRAAIEYGHSVGVALKGDIPIGVSPISVDAWVSPELFVMKSSAGAPPDDFSVTGQNWGFPIYNWEEMAKDGYGWWKTRFRKMAEYFDAYRIDHILGFFRIWEVPLDAVNALLGEFNPSMPYTADEIRYRGFDFNVERDVAHDYSSDNVLWLEYRHKAGHYYPRITPFSTERFASLSDSQKHAFAEIHNEFYYRRHNDFWKGIAESRLSMLVETTRMLTCGEDLGMIPDCVPEVMRNQQILSLEIERMPKDTGVEFGSVMNYPYMAVCTTSTHDMNPVRAWWRENRETTQHYYNNVMQWWGEAPADATPEICREIINRHLASPAMLTILPLQDWMSIDGALRYSDPDAERINVPANPTHYWRYRMHITLEELLANEQFNSQVEFLVKANYR
ncbi:MAG: 4-alpha-glucanotransferase [Alistipes sp.]|nr:4-alpha-glucanotransferase [Alistipes sp.]